MDDYILDEDGQFDINTAHFAGFGTRFLASIIDGLILGISLFVLSLPLSIILNEITALLLNNVISLVVYWLYFALQESSPAQATIGKKAMNIKVVNAVGERMSFGNATGRYFSKIISGLILMIGYIMAAFDEKKQALHDKIARTYVIQ